MKTIMDDNNSLVQSLNQDKQDKQWSAIQQGTKEDSFENMRAGSRIQKGDALFLLLYFLLVLALSSIIFGIAYGISNNTNAWPVFLVFILLYGLSLIYFMWSKDGKKHWELWLARTQALKQPKSYTLLDLERLFPIKSIAVNPITQTANKCFTSHDLNGPVVLYYKLIGDSPNDLSDKDLLKKVTGFSNWYIDNKRVDKKRGLFYDLTSFNTGVFDTSKQLKVKDEARKKKIDPVSLTLISEDYEMYENLASFLTEENEPTIFRFDHTPFNLINRYHVLAIKGNTYNDAITYAKMMIELLIEQTNFEVQPFSWIDTQNMLNKYFGNIINFKIQQPASTGVAMDDRSDFDEYDIYNVTRNPNAPEAYSMLEMIKDVKIHKDYLEIIRNTKDESKQRDYVMTLGFKDLPNRFFVGWLHDFTSSNMGIMVTQKLNSEKEKILNKKLRKQTAKNNALWRRAQSFLNEQDDYSSNKAALTHEKSVEFAQVLNEGDITLLDYRFYMVFRASTTDELYAIRNRFDLQLNQSLGIDENKREHYEWKQLDAFLSAFPDGIDFMRYKKANNNWITSLALAQSYPYTRNIDFLGEGIMIGIDNNYSRLIIINNLDASLANSYHLAIFASTGSGKSKLAQQICMMYATFRKNVKVWFFDANRDYVPLTEQMGGDVIYTDPKQNSMKPYSETLLATQHGTLMRLVLDTLLNIKVNGTNVIQRRPLIQKGPGYYLLINDKTLSPEDFKLFMNKNYNTLQNTKKEQCIELYKIIYEKCVKKFLLNPFRILDLLGDDIDAQTGIRTKPTSLKAYENHLSNLSQFFVVLLQNWAGVQSDLIDEAIVNTYEKVCRFKKQIDPSSNTAFLGTSSSREDEISLDDLLNWPKYPVFSDFYEQLRLLVERECRIDDDPASRTRYRDLLKVLRKFAIIKENQKNVPGSMSDLWNTDNKDLSFDANYTCFVTDAIAASQESEPFTDDLSVRTTIDSIGRAQFFLMVTLFRSYSRKNGLAKVGVKTSEQPFLMLFWDEAHNLIKHPLIEAVLLRLAKEGRKDNTGVCVITQDVGDITRLKSGKGIMNQFATKIYLGMGASGIKELDDLLSAIGGLSKISINWLINPRDYNTNVFRGDINIKPPGYAIISVNNADIFQIKFRTFYRIIDEMLTGSNLFVGSVSIYDIWQAYEEGFYPRSNLDDASSRRPMNSSHTNIIRRAKKWYEENLAIRQATGTQLTSNLIAQNNRLSQAIPVDISALTEFDNNLY